MPPAGSKPLCVLQADGRLDDQMVRTSSASLRQYADEHAASYFLMRCPSTAYKPGLLRNLCASRCSRIFWSDTDVVAVPGALDIFRYFESDVPNRGPSVVSLCTRNLKCIGRSASV